MHNTAVVPLGNDFHEIVRVVFDWDILVPKGFDLTSPEAEELLNDHPEEGFTSLN